MNSSIKKWFLSIAVVTIGVQSIALVAHGEGKKSSWIKKKIEYYRTEPHKFLDDNLIYIIGLVGLTAAYKLNCADEALKFHLDRNGIINKNAFPSPTYSFKTPDGLAVAQSLSQQQEIWGAIAGVSAASAVVMAIFSAITGIVRR